MKYSVETIIENVKVLRREDFVFFWGHVARAEKQAKACLSQWYPCGFEVDGFYYNCAEQFMMAEKARLFHDEELCKKSCRLTTLWNKRNLVAGCKDMMMPCGKPVASRRL